MSLKAVKMSPKGVKTAPKGGRVCFKGGKTSQLECVRLEINGHMSSVGEQILCDLKEHTSGDVFLQLRVFVLERLSAAAQFMCSLFQREMETLHNTELVHTAGGGIGEKRKKAKEITKRSKGKKKRDFFASTEEVSTGQQERSSSLVREEPRHPHTKERPEESCTHHAHDVHTLLKVKCVHGDDNSEPEPVAGTSTGYMKTRADVEDCGTSRPTRDDHVHSSHCSESDAEEKSVGDDEHRDTERPVAGTSAEHMRTQAYIAGWVRSRPTTDEQLLFSHFSESDGEMEPLSGNSDEAEDSDDWTKNVGEKKMSQGPNATSMMTKIPTGGEGFRLKENLKRHMRTPTGERPYTCTVCGKGFIRTYHLKRHMKIHGGTNPCPDLKTTPTRSSTGKKNQTGKKPCPDLKTSPKKSFLCTYCGKSFNEKKSLNIHEVIHTGEKLCTCTVCGQGFDRIYHLNRHMMVIHKVKKPCETTSTGSSTEKNIHKAIHTVEKPCKCTVCGKGFNRKYHVHRHMMAIHKLEMPCLICSYCGKTFNEMRCLKIHKTIHRGEKTCKCTVCGKGFDRMYHLKRHRMPRTGGNPCEDLNTTSTSSSPEKKSLLCSICGKMFNEKTCLKRHIMIHTGERPFTCTVCGRSFIQMYHLKRHSKNNCGESSTLRRNRKTHMTDTGEKTYICTVCGKVFKSSQNLTVHTRTHTGEKPCICNVCGKSFRQSSTLKTHMRTHTGEKPFSCTVCGRRSSSTSFLKKHMRTHTGEKPFTCTVCGKAFSRPDDAKRHMMSHTGEKAVTCSACGKGFIRRATLIIHMRTHTGEKPYTCTVCGKSCSQKGDLKRHMRTHKGGENT